MPKTVFVAHPISGDIKGNVKEVLEICRKIHTEHIIPLAPYLVSLQYLNDEVHEERRLGIEANLECFRRKMIDELWLFGDFISPGMLEEIKIARSISYRIPVIAKTHGTKIDFKKFCEKNPLKLPTC
ncbi:DUF4406 domain-containing protein [Candidatus Azambacteria bacterium]|nr:DUF4406 domain-containing protein [Candidatus Azambacteria bacterium]MBI3685288.1 DUF4406 domain-containing protein [Candidatus Azambacteria bacterium]